MTTPKIIVPLRAKTWAELQSKLDQLPEKTDLVEIWLDQLFVDLMRNPALIPEVASRLQNLKQSLGVEVLAVCKSPQEAGQFGGTPSQRIELLQAFLQLGGDWVDVDIRLNHKDLIRQLPLKKCWLSLHDFTGVPENFESLVREMKTLAPAVYKFAVTPQNEAELTQFVDFARDFGQKHTAIFTTMGPLGETGRTRLESHSWGAFYALSETEKTASGQLTINQIP